MSLLNVDFVMCVGSGFPMSLFDHLKFSISAFSVASVLLCLHGRTEYWKLPAILPNIQKCCDNFFVLTMSLYAFISLLYKQLLQYTLL